MTTCEVNQEFDSPSRQGPTTTSKSIALRILLVLVMASGFGLMPTPKVVSAHGGGLDGNGGHNCRVGSCAGTYHCHRCPCGCSTSSNSPNRPSPPPTSRPSVSLARCVRTSGVTYFSKNEIALMQAMLKFLGYNPGPIDGIYGSRTRGALNSFETRFGLTRSSSSSIYYSSISRLLIACR